MSGQLNLRQNNNSATIPPGEGALLKFFEKNGKFPPMTLSIFPLENLSQEIFIDKFMSYRFQESVLVPVASWSCEVKYDLKVNGIRNPAEGDIFVLRANGIPISTGVVDQLDMETDASSGTKLTIQGRNLLGLWEDQDSVSLDSKVLWGNKYTVDQVVQALAQETRINPKNLVKRDAPSIAYLFATQAGESKLSSIQRYCEGLDIFFWLQGDGSMIIGKPDMHGIRSPNKKPGFFMLRDSRVTNCLAMRTSRASSSVPSIMVPIWNGQESVQDRIKEADVVKNRAQGPARLLALGHRVVKATVVSTPSGADPQDLSAINALLVANQNVAKGNQYAATILKVYAEREMARANLNCLKVQATTAGHYNDQGQPLAIDQVYRVQYDVDNVDEDMYLYEVEHTMTEGEGQRSRLFFCQKTALVSKVRAL